MDEGPRLAPILQGQLPRLPPFPARRSELDHRHPFRIQCCGPRAGSSAVGIRACHGKRYGPRTLNVACSRMPIRQATSGGGGRSSRCACRAWSTAPTAATSRPDRMHESRTEPSRARTKTARTSSIAQAFSGGCHSLRIDLRRSRIQGSTAGDPTHDPTPGMASSCKGGRSNAGHISEGGMGGAAQPTRACSASQMQNPSWIRTDRSFPILFPRTTAPGSPRQLP